MLTLTLLAIWATWLLRALIYGPDLNIGPDYMHRWYIIPRNPWFNIYLHKIMKDDDDRALHDHPWHSLSFVIRGVLREILPHRWRILHPSLIPIYRPPTLAHRLEVARGPVWTLFITGPRVREWGFHCPKGFVHWSRFVDSRDSGKTGKGCDQ